MCNALLQLQPNPHNALPYSHGDNAVSSAYGEENSIGSWHTISDWITPQCGYVNKIVTFAVTMGESSTTSSL